MEPKFHILLENQVQLDVEKYKLDRETEREVYKAVGGYEHAGLRTLLALNGGSATAFLTLLGTIWQSGLGSTSTLLAAGAIGAWVLGLALTGFAIRKMYRAHRSIAEQFRYRRLGDEVSHGIRQFLRTEGSQSKGTG